MQNSYNSEYIQTITEKALNEARQKVDDNYMASFLQNAIDAGALPKFEYIQKIKDPAPVNSVAWRYNKPTALMVDPLTLPNFFRMILNTTDFVCTVYGIKNIGKSQSIIELARQICPDFCLEEDVVFTLEDFYESMEKGKDKRWRIKILDDFGSEMDPVEGMFDINRHTSQYFQTSRTFKTGAFITTPNPKFINKDMRDRLTDFTLEIKSRNRRAGYTIATLQFIQRNIKYSRNYFHNLTYNPGLQALRLTRKKCGYNCWSYVLYPPPQEIRDEYEPLRELKGRRNLARGRADFLKLKATKMSIDEIVDAVMEEPGKYTSYRKSSGKLYIDKGLIAYTFGVGSGDMQKVTSVLRLKLPDKPKKQKKE